MANTLYLGHELSIIVDSSIVANTTDWDLSVDKEVVDVTNFLSAGWSDKKVYGKDWKIGFSGMVGNYDSSSYKDFDNYMNSLLTSDASIYVGMKNSSANWLMGCGYLTSLKTSGSKGIVVAYQGTIEGTGALTLTALA